MKQAKNNEIDLLLRKLAQGERDDSAKTTGRAGVAAEIESSEHLDTDELNAYAEKAIPANSRMRYTEHLADCSRCRKLVTELTLASGASVRQASLGAKAPSHWAKYLSLFFSPSVRPFVIPAFALVVIVTIALVTVRRKPSQDFVAQNAPGSSAPFSSNQEVGEAQHPALSETSRQRESPVSPERRSDSKSGNEAVKGDRTETKALDKTATDDARQVSKEPPREESSNVAAARTAGEPPRAAPAPTKPQVTDKAESQDEIAKQKKPEVVTQPAVSKEEDKERRVSSFGIARIAPKKAESQPAGGRSEQGAVYKDAPATAINGVAKRRNEDGVRTVGGHRFHKEGVVWIDSAYDSARPTVNLSRGSEQYRALVADEPGIRTIAEQLDGEVIVVWKGRAYRIR